MLVPTACPPRRCAQKVQPAVVGASIGSAAPRACLKVGPRGAPGATTTGRGHAPTVHQDLATNVLGNLQVATLAMPQRPRHRQKKTLHRTGTCGPRRLPRMLGDGRSRLRGVVQREHEVGLEAHLGTLELLLLNLHTRGEPSRRACAHVCFDCAVSKPGQMGRQRHCCAP